MKTKTANFAFLPLLFILLVAWQTHPVYSSPETLWLGSGSVTDTPAPSATNGPQYKFEFASPSGTVSTIGNELVAHSETTTIAGTNYYLLKKVSADTAGTTLTKSMASTGRTLWGQFVYSLQGISSIPASTWTMYYRAWRDTPSIAFDAVGSGNNGGGSTSVSWSHSTGSGSNRIMVVGVSIRTTTVSVSSITYGAQSLTFIRADTHPSATIRGELWYLIAPASGTNTVTVTLSGTSKATGGSCTYTGVAQTLPIDANGGGTGTSNSPSKSVTVNTANSWLLGHVAITGSGQTVSSEGSGQTPRWDQATTGGNAASRNRGHGSDKGPVGTGSQTMSWTLSSSADWAVSVAAFKPVLPVGHADVDILIRRSDGTIRTTIATNVANSADLTTTSTTLSGTYSFAGYTVADQTDYLEIDHYIEVTTTASVSAYLRIDDNTLAIADQTRANIPTPVYWYTLKYTGTLSAGTYTLTIYYRASTASATVSIDKTAPDGTFVSAIGSTTWTPTDSATITSTTVSISGSATSFTDERLRLKIDCTSGVLAVYFDSSSQPSKLDTPAGTPPIPEFPSTEFQIAILVINLLIVSYLLRREKKSTRN